MRPDLGRVAIPDLLECGVVVLKVGQSGGMVEKHPHRYLIAVSNADGPTELRELILEAELPLADELQDDVRGERLGDAGDFPEEVGPHWNVGCQGCLAERSLVLAFALLPYAHDSAGDLAVPHRLLDRRG